MLPGITLAGGKVKNPFVHTDILWDSDVNLDGLYQSYELKDGYFRPFVTLAAGYYDFDEYERSFRGTNGNAVDGDGVLAAGDFNIVDVVAELGTKLGGVPVKVIFDYAVNTADDARGASQFEGKDTAIAGHLKIGKCKAKGDWELKYKYAFIEANAVPGDFCDSDFGHANRKGHKLSLGYKPFNKASLHVTGLLTEPKDLLKGQRSLDHFTVQTDLVVKL